MTIASHFERHLGPVQQGWKRTPPTASGIRALLFENQPVQGVDTLGTLGLSDEALPLSDGKHVRQEFIISMYPKYPKDPKDQLGSFLTTFADFIRSKNQALLRGDVVGPFRPIITGVRASAIYASLPAFFENTFATYRGTEPPTVVVWLVPLVGGEAGFIKERGWEQFEDLLEARGDVDFWDLDREPATKLNRTEKVLLGSWRSDDARESSHAGSPSSIGGGISKTARVRACGAPARGVS